MKDLKSFTLVILLSGYFFCFGRTQTPIYDTLTEKELIEIFTYMKKEENSYLKMPGVRLQIFLNNFNTIVSITKSQGFPQLKKEYKLSRKRYCIFFFSSVNFLHVLQTKPEVLLNFEIINLFKIEIEFGRLDREIVSYPIQAIRKLISLGHATLSQKNIEMLNYAASEWDIGGVEIN